MSTTATSYNNLNPTMLSGLPEASPGDSQGSKAAEIQSLLNELSVLMQEQMQQGLNGTGSGQTDPADSYPTPMGTAAPSAGATSLPQSGTPAASANGTSLPQSGAPASSGGNSNAYSALDSYSAQNDQSDLSQWSNLAASSQGISLERPIAAMQILSGKPDANGQPPTTAQKQAAMQYVNDNPSLKSALQNAGALNSDGSINQSKLKSFMQSVQSDLSQANSNVQAYMKKNPNADANSLNTVRAAALLQAYNPIAGESTGHESNGGKNQSYSGSGKNNGGGLVTEQQVKNLANNQGFSSALTSAANAFSTSGAFDALDRAGDDKATTKADGMYNNANLSAFMNSGAPTSSATDQSFLQDASLQNITANTDTSNLNQDIFQNPQNYTPQQKAAVMVKLMETLVNVQAGGADGLKNVSATVNALTKDIQTLASDPATQAYLQHTVPPAMQNLGGMFQQAGGLSSTGAGNGTGGGTGTGGSTGTAGSGQSSQTSGSDIAQQVHDGLDNAKSVSQSLSDLANGKGFMGLGGDTEAASAAGAAGGAEGAAGGAEGAAAGADAGVAGAEGGAAAAEGVAGGAAVADGVMGAVAGGLAAATPVLAVGAGIAGIVGIVMAIVQAVQKKQHQNEFASNVNPTLQQFGIPLPS